MTKTGKKLKRKGVNTTTGVGKIKVGCDRG